MNNKIIIAISGRKNAGKNVASSFIKSYLINKRLYTAEDIMECSFADTLKSFCVETLGLKYEQCYGSDQEKNEVTKYCWEKAPRYLRWLFGNREMIRTNQRNDHCFCNGKECEFQTEHDSIKFDSSRIKNVDDFYFETMINESMPSLRSGFMTGREVMQVFGTELVRSTFGNVWAQSTVRKINNSSATVAIITDNRFPNEIESVLNEPCGYIIRLTRSPFGTEDQHPSEASLDDYNWDRKKCYVLDNKDMNIDQQNEAMKPILDVIFMMNLEK